MLFCTGYTIVKKVADSQSIKVTFISMDVLDDCDNWPNGTGEFYYTFKIDDDIIITVSESSPRDVDSGNTVSLNESRVIQRLRQNGQSFTVFGEVSEDDDLGSGGDDNAGRFINTHTFEQNWNQGVKDVRLNQDGCDVIVHYKVEVLN